MRTVPVLALLAAAALAQSAVRPRHNDSYVPEADDVARGLIEQATRAAAVGEPEAAAARLQSLCNLDERGVVPVRGRELFVSTCRWARLALLGERPPFGKEVLAAWRKAHDLEANTALEGAVVSGDELEIERLLMRYPAATGAPAALLGLCDRALLRGDPDGARGALLRIWDHVPRSDEERWRGSPAYRERRRFLASLPPRRPSGWPTLGGDATRARTGSEIAGPGGLKLLWETRLLERVPPDFRFELEDRDRAHSPILPFYPVCDERRLYVHTGPCVAIVNRASGKLEDFAPGGQPPDFYWLDSQLARSPGVRAATVADGVLYFARVLFDDFDDPLPRNALTAYDVAGKRVLWDLQPGRRPRTEEILSRPVFFRGAPAVVGDRLYVYGAVREQVDGDTTRKEEAHLFCFRRGDHALLWHRFLGYGDTDAAPMLPPQSGLAPAVAAGVVVTVTGLGVAAAHDAISGETLWIFRYDRTPARERERLTEWTEEKVHRGSAWFREAPRILGETVLLAPFDSRDAYACWLRGRRDGDTGGLGLVQWSKDRSRHLNSMLEYVAGTAAGRVFYVGRRDARHTPEAYQAVVSNPLGNEYELAYGRIPSLERDVVGLRGVPPEVYGRPVIAGGTLLVPTEGLLFRFDVGRPPAAARHAGERIREIAPLPHFEPAAPDPEDPSPRFGTLVAVDGLLYVVGIDRVMCYGP